MFAALFHGPGVAEDLRLRKGSNRDNIRHGRLTLRQGSCLVEDDRVCFVSQLELVASFDQDSILCSLAGPDEQGRWGCNSQRAGARDDNYGDEREKRERESYARDKVPEHERRYRDKYDRGNKVR